MTGYQQILLNGSKGDSYSRPPAGMIRISPISYIYYQKDLGLQCLWRGSPT